MSLNIRIARFVFIALLAFAPRGAHGATLAVTTSADSGPGSLRDAIGLANVNGTDDEIVFTPSLRGKTVALTTGPLQIDEFGTTLTITATNLPGGIIVSGGGRTRVFDIFSGTTVILDSLVITEGDDAYGSGVLSEATLTLRRCWVTRNTARHGSGAGLWQYSGYLTIDRTTFSENIAVGDGEAFGGGAYLLSASAEILSSTFSGNCAAAALGNGQGGAIYQTGGAVFIRQCTFVGNRARGLSSYGGALLASGLAEAGNSIFAENEAIFGPDLYSGLTPISSGGYNFVGVGTNSLGITNGVNGDRVGTALRPLIPQLGPLQFNGGLTPTHSPLAGSPVIDISTNTVSTPETDQRGLPRLADGDGSGLPGLDIGAVEAGPIVFVTTASDSADGLHLGGLSLREALANAKAPDTRILFDTTAFAIPQIELDPLKGPLVFRENSIVIDASLFPSPLVLHGRNATRVIEITGSAVATLTHVRLAAGRAGAGGGLRCAAGATANLDRCSITDCVSTNAGGAIANAGWLTVHNSGLIGNTTTRGHGGALDNSGGRAALSNTLIADNTASVGHGGGIHNGSNGWLLLSQCAVQHNTASGSGGGIFNSGTNSPADATVRHSTIVFNVAGLPGGGVANSNTLRSTHSLIACNRRGTAPNDFAGQAVSEGYNLLGATNGASGFNGAGDVRGAEPRLHAFGSLMGLLYCLESDSPAIDAGFNTTSLIASNLIYSAAVPARDLVGQNRAVNGAGGGKRVDVGAIEYQANRSFAVGGVPWPVPGRFEAEDFDAGGPAVGYSDTSPANLNGSYRPDDGVDIETTLDDDGAFDVTATTGGEWMRYSVEVQSSGRYTLLLRVAANTSSAALRVEIDGTDLTGNLVIPNTGGGQDWLTLKLAGIELTGGHHVLRLVWTGDGASLNWIEWQSEAAQHGLTRLLYLNRGGTFVSDFYPEPRGQGIFPAAAEPFGLGSLASGRVTEFESPPDIADDYGVALAGFIEPSVPGAYFFYLCSDNEGELWLSSDESPANAARIAVEPEGNPPRTWVGGAGRPAVGGIPVNISAPVFLEAGRRYYVEAIAKEGDGGDNLAITWQRLGDPTPTNGAPPIGSAWLRPFLSGEPAIPSGSAFFVGVPKITPTFQTINPTQPGASVDFRALAVTTGPVSYEWLLNGAPVAGTNFSGTNSSVLKILNPTAAQAGLYTVVIRGPTNTNASAPAVLGVQTIASPDINPPALVVTAPSLATVTTTTNSFTLAGTAFDTRGVLAVLVSGDSFTNVLAAGTTNWTFAASLNIGTNRFAIRSVDRVGNTSAVVARTIVLPNTNRLVLTISGLGTVAPNLTNTPLFVGRNYKLTATPRAGYVFAGWSGGMVSLSNVLSFRMTSGLALQANFIPSPFTARKGSYNGLFYQTNEVRHENSGFITATVTDLGAFSGKLTITGKPLSFSGRLTPGGATQVRLVRRGLPTLTLDLRLDEDGADQLLGGLTDGSWVAEVLADRAVFNATNAAPFAGRHTIIFPTAGDDGVPGGDGFGTPVVSLGGKITFSGVLADGNTVSQSTPVARAGEWPFYAALYGGKGSILGWLTFSTNTPDASIAGLVDWSKPPLPSPKLYTNGFTTQFAATGSTYVPPGTNRVLAITNGIVQFTEGNLISSPLPFQVALTNGNKVVHTNGSRFSLTLTTANGLFSGTFIPPGTNTVLRYRGALLQQANRGAGFFLNRDASGRVAFEQAP